MSGCGWGALVAPVDVDEDPPASNGGGDLDGTSGAELLQEADAATALPGSGWGAFVAHPAIGTGEVQSAELPEQAEEETFDLAGFAAPQRKRRGRPSAAVAALEPLQNTPVAWDSISKAGGLSTEQDAQIGGTGLASSSTSGLQPHQGLQVPQPHTYIRPAVQGVRLPSLCATGLATSIVQAQTSATLLDQDYLRLFQHYVVDSEHHNASAKVRAELLSISKFQLETKVFRLAASQSLHSRQAQAGLKQELVAKLDPADLVA